MKLLINGWEDHSIVFRTAVHGRPGGQMRFKRVIEQNGHAITFWLEQRPCALPLADRPPTAWALHGFSSLAEDVYTPLTETLLDFWTPGKEFLHVTSYANANMLPASMAHIITQLQTRKAVLEEEVKRLDEAAVALTRAAEALGEQAAAV